MLDADTARALANNAAERARWTSERVAWRLPELDPALVPGTVVRLPGKSGLWRIETWEWRETGVEVELERLPHTAGRAQPGNAGEAIGQPDEVATPTLLHAVEMPWVGSGSGSERKVVALVSSAGGGWRGAALFASRLGVLTPIGGTGRQRAALGELITPLPPRQSHRIDWTATCDVELASPDFMLGGATIEALASGANRAVIGGELIQFGRASRLSPTQWRLSALLRGRAGTEAEALTVHPATTFFALLDGAEVSLDGQSIDTAEAVAASGLADATMVTAAIAAGGRTQTPLTPVHARSSVEIDGALNLRWTRRARAALEWRDLVDVPLNEGSERYLVGAGPVDAPLLTWETAKPALVIPAATAGTLSSGVAVWVRQIGTHRGSAPLLLHTVPGPSTQGPLP